MGIVLVGSHPSGESFWWGLSWLGVLVGNHSGGDCPGWESS